MKKLLILALCFAFTACNKDSAPDSLSLEDMIKAEGQEEFDCVMSQADSAASLADAKSWIVGKWQLKGMITMMPSAEVQNIQVEFKEDGGVMVYLADELKYTDAYSLIESEEGGNTYLRIVTDNLLSGQNEYNITRGGVRICEDELFIDHGIAFDAPGYLFRKVTK